jgi:hypothetical protein
MAQACRLAPFVFAGVVPSGAKARSLLALDGTAKAVPFPIPRFPISVGLIFPGLIVPGLIFLGLIFLGLIFLGLIFPGLIFRRTRTLGANEYGAGSEGETGCEKADWAEQQQAHR